MIRPAGAGRASNPRLSDGQTTVQVRNSSPHDRGVT